MSEFIQVVGFAVDLVLYVMALYFGWLGEYAHACYLILLAQASLGRKR